MFHPHSLPSLPDSEEASLLPDPKEAGYPSTKFDLHRQVVLCDDLYQIAIILE